MGGITPFMLTMRDTAISFYCLCCKFMYCHFRILSLGFASTKTQIFDKHYLYNPHVITIISYVTNELYLIGN